MNVTPLIDVLLVLIIIFMTILPSNSIGLNARLPQQSDQDAPSAPVQDVVITVHGDKTVRLNQEAPLALEDLGKRLASVFGGATSRVIFIRAEKNLEFQQIAEVIDIVKGAGLNQIALMTQ